MLIYKQFGTFISLGIYLPRSLKELIFIDLPGLKKSSVIRTVIEKRKSSKFYI